MEKRPYSFARNRENGKAKKPMMSFRLDPAIKSDFGEINEILKANNLPVMSQAEILDTSVQNFKESLPELINRSK